MDYKTSILPQSASVSSGLENSTILGANIRIRYASYLVAEWNQLFDASLLYASNDTR
jgi:hypothetical protein